MSHIQTHCRTNGACLGFGPGDACPKPMNYKAYKRPDRQLIAICADGPKYLDPAIAFEMHLAILRRDENFADRTVAAAIRTDFPVFRELGQPMTPQAARQLEIGRPQSPLLGGFMP
jgi:hypothetical protein